MRRITRKLWVRLTLAFLLIAWLGIGALALVVNTTTQDRFRQYLGQRDAGRFDESLLASLEAHYAATGSWAGADALLPGPGGGGQGGGERRGERLGSTVLLADAAGTVVVSTDPARIGEPLDESLRDVAITLEVDGQRAGWIVQDTPGTQALGDAEHQFLEDTTLTLAVTALLAALLAVVAGLGLAWQLTRPLGALTAAAHDLAGGGLGRQVEARGTAEIVALAQAFNHMSRDLAEGEKLRQRMAADVAHELRTPVSVLRGHLEAMLDGVFPLDQEHLAIAYNQAIHLARLVEDLRLLTRAEAGQLPLDRARVDPGALAGLAVERFRPLALDAGIVLESAIAPDLPPVQVDADRIHQVLGNLLTNALRHTPPEGRITLRVTRVEDTVRFAVSNTGYGLTPEEAARAFQPFWRAEEARTRDSGGIGLGLAIARQLVALHGGRVWVESAPDRTTFLFELPAQAGGEGG